MSELNPQNIPFPVQEFDGTQPEVEPSERELVATKFSSLVDDLMLNFAEDVRYYEAGKENSLLMKSIISPDEQWLVAVRSKEYNETSPFPDEDIILKEISIRHTRKGQGRENVAYRLFADGVLRRWDGGDAYKKGQKNRELGISEPKDLDSEATREEVVQAAIEGLMRQPEKYKNHKLEQSMGYQLQPISLEELDGLGAWLDAQKLQP